MARYERIVNNVQTSLDGGITAGATSIDVVNGSSYPSEGDYRILVDSEAMLVTARSVNTLTVVRGVDGTTAASHLDGALVNVILTQTGLDAWLNNATGNSSYRNPSRLLDSSGNVLTKASFTGDNVADSWLENNPDGSITCLSNNSTISGTNHHVWYKSAPAAPWKVTACFQWGIGFNYASHVGGANASVCGLLCRENSTQEFILISVHAADRLDVNRYTNPTTFSAAVSGRFEPHSYSSTIWLQIEDDNVDLFWRCSHDGINWFEIASEGRTAFMAGGPDDIGFNISERGPGSGEGSEKEFTIKSWLEE